MQGLIDNIIGLSEMMGVYRFFPSTKKCSKCGNIREISLDERTYMCSVPECKNEMNRDWNSAINIENEGLRQTGTEYTIIRYGQVK